MRQKYASENEGKGIQNSEQARNAMRGRKVGTTKKQEKRIDVKNEMRMLRWMREVTRSRTNTSDGQ